MNTQPIEKRVTRIDGMLDVHSIFYTIQGEGPFCGTPCVFVRLAGCNLQCPACDTDYTTGRQNLHFKDLATQVISAFPGPWARARLVVITGGEPFRQPIGPFIELLISSGFYVQVETNGAIEPPPLNYTLDPGVRHGAYIVCSPKTGKVHPSIWKVACAVKYILESGLVSPDGLPALALGHSANPRVARPPEGWNRPVYVQPMDEHDEQMNKLHLRAAVDSCLAHGYALQLQVHKIIGVE